MPKRSVPRPPSVSASVTNSREPTPRGAGPAGSTASRGRHVAIHPPVSFLPVALFRIAPRAERGRINKERKNRRRRRKRINKCRWWVAGRSQQLRFPSVSPSVSPARSREFDLKLSFLILIWSVHNTFDMKLLEYTPFDCVNVFLDQLNLGDCTIRGSLEAFSCKHAGNDRRLSISLEHEILDYLGKSSDSDPPSPVEHLSCRSSRKTLIYLVLTLGHMYPDYEFSAVRAHLFFKEEDWESFKQMLDNYLSEASTLWAAKNEGSSLLDSMTKAIDEVIKIRECDIYSYNPDSDGDPFLEKGAIWSINFFFYNRKLKRVVSFRCCCTSKFAGDDFLAGALSDGDEDALIDMDI